MQDLIEALTIFLKYGNPEYPTYCSNEELLVVGIDADAVTAEDLARLQALSFRRVREYFISSRFGSA